MNKAELNEALARYRKEFRYLDYVSEAGEEIWRDPKAGERDVRNILVLGEKKYFEFLHIFQSDHPDFSGMDLSGLNFNDAVFDLGEKFVDTILIGADMCSCDFTENDMRGVDFSYADLRGSYFKRCDLSGACFEGAELEDVNFIECNMRGCNITKECRADFIGCYGLPWLNSEKRTVKMVKINEALRDIVPFDFIDITSPIKIIVDKEK